MRDGHEAPVPRGHKVWALLTYLACTPGRTHRAHLAALLFPEAQDPLAALRWNLSELRRLLGQVALRGECPALQLQTDAFIDVQVVLAGTWAQALALPGLGRPLLEGMNFGASAGFDVWLVSERRRVAAATEGVLREAAQSRLAMGAPGEAAELASRLVGINPLDENHQALWVRSLAAAGDGVGAARQAAAAGELLRRELGVAPGPALAAAMQTATASPLARPATGRAAAIAQLEAGQAAVQAGAHEAGLQCLRRAVLEADATCDASLRVRARIALGGALVHAARGRDEEGVIALHEALAVTPPSLMPLAAAACRELGYVEFLRGRYDRAQTWLDRAAAAASTDLGEQAAIATVHGASLSDTGHYAQAVAKLETGVALARRSDDARQLAYALSMLGRAHLLCGDLTAAGSALEQSIEIARARWTAFLPWPQSLAAEVALERGDLQGAADQFEHAFALGCQMGDPCWEGIAGRGLGRVAAARGLAAQAVELLLDSVRRSARLADAYVWGKAYTLDALCEIAVSEDMAEASTWIDELQLVAARSGMRELLARAHLHRFSLGDPGSGLAGRLLAQSFDNPVLRRLAAA